MNKRQDIVPVQLKDEKQTVHPQYRKQNPQKLVARLKGVDSELFIYEGIQEAMLRVLLSELSAQERYDLRLTHLKPKLENFFDWCESLAVLGKTKLGTAISYALKQKERMMNVLKDGRLVLSNNLAERGIKTLLIGRKNYLFSASFKGAQSNAMILSLVETAKANGLHPRKYLEYLLIHLPNRKNTPLEAYLPWAPKVQVECTI